MGTKELGILGRLVCQPISATGQAVLSTQREGHVLGPREGGIRQGLLEVS